MKAEELGVRIFLAISPLYDELLAERPFFDRVNKVMAELSGIAAKHPRLHLIDDIYAAPVDELRSVDHLNARGAVRYSQWLRRQISQH